MTDSTKVEAEDLSKTKPNLHLLYVKWGVKHLYLLDKCIQLLTDESNLNLLGAISALHRERTKLVEENKAYQDAEEILRGIRAVDGLLGLECLEVYLQAQQPEREAEHVV